MDNILKEILNINKKFVRRNSSYIQQTYNFLKSEETPKNFFLDKTLDESQKIVSTFTNFSLLQELTYKDLKYGVDNRTKEKVKGLAGTRYDSSTPGGMVVFKTKSSQFHKNNIIYTQRIVPLELIDVLLMEDLTPQEKVNLAISGDIAVSCDCPAFAYWGHAYILTQMDAIEGEGEDRIPKIRNPHLKGTVCKHLLLVLKTLPFNISNILRDYEKQGVFDIPEDKLEELKRSM